MGGPAAIDRHPTRPSTPVIVSFLAGGTLVALMEPQTPLIHTAVVVPGVVMVVFVISQGWHRQRLDVPVAAGGARWNAGLAVWLLLGTVALTFQLLILFASPLDVYPTVSSLLAQVYVDPVRAITFVAWLWLGWYLVRR